MLAKSFLDKAVEEHGLRPMRLSADALRALQAYDWPGNVRELKNAIESAAVLARTDIVTADGLPSDVGGDRAHPASGESSLFHVGMSMADLERNAILATLAENDGNRTRAARMLAISLRTLQRKLKEYGLADPTEA